MNGESTKAPVERAERLWAEHQLAPFPEGWAGEEVEGIDLVLLDADAAGCIASYFGSRCLGTWHTAVLGLCNRELAVVARRLPNGPRDYFARLEVLAGLVLEMVRDQAAPRLQ